MNELPFGLQPGDKVRWQRKPRGMWHEFTVTGINKDGSITCVGPNGHRSLMPERLERQTKGPRGAIVWTPLMEVTHEST